MQVITINNKGEREVDPYNNKGKHEAWLRSIGYFGEQADYFAFTGVSSEASELITNYVMDLYTGKNLPKGTYRGQRSFNHLCNIRIRLRRIVELLESSAKKPLLQLSEDDVLLVFNNMRNGVTLSSLGRPFLDTSSYARAFMSFWRWIMRVRKETPNIVDSLDTKKDNKPKWFYFTLKDVERMADAAPNFYYKALVYFLFDSGLRAPTELMNVRVMDLSDVPGCNLLFLNIRDETSKTFGRKIKLMISSDLVRQYVKKYDLKREDFLFSTSYIVMTRTIGRLAYNTLKVGVAIKQKNFKVLVRQGVTMYDFRHNSVCHYLPIYNSENQIKYRYGWRKSEMIHYYSEFMGMRDTITEDDMLIDTTKTEIQQALQKEQQLVAVLQEQLNNQKKDTDERIRQLEALMLQKFADNFSK
ncbi:site-specific integrase [Candidatus Woesearchaeota archaeon]|nr:site-specific integrase [Candidatus Woesearchaeota archaeon]